MDGEIVQFIEMGGGERLEPACPGVGELQSNDPMITVITDTADQPRSVGAFDQAAGAVVSQQEVFGHVADRRAPAVRVPTDREQ